jgi:WhiB family redox-sensing transcriptional regulator
MFKPSQTPSCEGTDTEAFFVIEGTKAYPDKELITRICKSCPVANECLEYALHHSVVGWWANTGEKQRSRMRTQRNIIPEPITIRYLGEAC